MWHMQKHHSKKIFFYQVRLFGGENLTLVVIFNNAHTAMFTHQKKMLLKNTS